MVFYNEKGKAVKIYSYSSEEQQRFEQGIEILYKLYKQQLEEQAEKKIQKEQLIDSQIEETDKKIFKRCTKRLAKRYNMS